MTFCVDPSSVSSPFLILTLDLPPSPLFIDDQDRTNIIPQIPIESLLAKYDGITTKEEKGGIQRRYSILQLPNYLILCVKRFTKQPWEDKREKNPTIVTFPLNGLDMSEYVDKVRKDDEARLGMRYDLIANICHEGEPTGGHYKVYVRKMTIKQRENSEDTVMNGDKDILVDQWFLIQDLVVEQVPAQVLLLSESYIQVP